MVPRKVKMRQLDKIKELRGPDLTRSRLPLSSSRPDSLAQKLRVKKRPR